MKKTCENIVHYGYIYRFNPLFRKNEEVYKWIMKKYLSNSDIGNFEENIEKMKGDEKNYNKFQKEMSILDSEINLNQNTHPFRLRLSEFKKDYLKILILFLANYYSVTSKNILQIERISRQLSISSEDLKYFLKNSLQEFENIQHEEYIENILDKIKKLDLDEIEMRILKTDIALLIYFQKEKKNNQFVKLFLKRLKVTAKEIKYITKEIIQKQEEENEK